MTFEVTHYAYEHRQGTKEYEIVHITDQDNGREVLINRWGKVGRLVGKKVVGDTRGSELARSCKARVDRGYQIQSRSSEAMTAEAAAKKFPQPWALYREYLGAAPEAVLLEAADGSIETIRLEHEPPPPPVETATDNNPLLGIF